MEYKVVKDSSERLCDRLLKGPAVVFAAQRGDEVLGCGGALRKLVLGNERVLLVVVNRDDQDATEVTGSAGLCVDRKAATKAAAELLGYSEPVFLNEPAPGLSYREDTVQRILDVVAGFGASIVYAPSIDEPRDDRFKLGLAAREAVRRRADDCALAFYGVETAVSANQILDIGDVSARKKQAIDCFQPTEARIPGAEASLRLRGKPDPMLRPEIDTTEGFDFWLPHRLVDPIPKLSRPERWQNDGTPTGDCLVSVVIRTTGRETLADALDSIAAQTYPSIEVLLVDVEGRGSLVAGAWCGRFPMRTVSQGQHLGRGAAANAGVDAAEGDYVVLLDDDDWFLPDHVHSLVSTVSSSEDARAAYSGIECRRRNDVGVWEVLRVFNEPYDRTSLLVENYLPMHSVLFDRGLLGSWLRFDESFKVYEDWDFWIQLSALTPLAHVNRVTAIYRISETSGFGMRSGDPEVVPGNLALLKKWRTRWSSEQLIAIARRASQSVPKAIPDAGRERADANTASPRRRIFELEQTVAAYQVHVRDMEEASGAGDARISELEQVVGAREARIGGLEGSVAEREAHIGDLQSELTSEREQEHEIVALKNQVLQELNGIQTSASWQLARPLRALESRWPRLVRGVAALPKLAWWVLTLRLPQRLRVRRLASELLETGLFDRIWYVKNNPDVVLDGRNPLFHWLAQGWTEGRDPNPLFDTDWYVEQNPDVAESGVNPLEHYLEVGAAQGRDPSPLFDTDWYLAQYPDVAEMGVNPLAHFLSRGAAEGRTGQPQPQPDVATASPETYVALYDQMLDNAARLPHNTEYLPETDVAVDPTSLPVRLIAFYLPQFHPIPENDNWWGRGFTEWTNVTKALPQFEGHYQPRLPGALGFYDLRVKEVQREQIRLAKKHGIYGFCYHHYWFGGKRLLERPLQQVLDDPSLDLPFCVCWANENWTRRWDGYDQEVLIGQDHSVEDDLAFIAELEPAFRDPRYIRIHGRPLLIVYRPQLFPDPAATAAHWRQYARDRLIPEPYLVNVRSFPETIDPRSIGFDAAVEFPPHQYPRVDITHEMRLLNKHFRGQVLDYRACVEEAEKRVSEEWSFDLYPGVMTAWDNTPRRLNQGTVFANATPDEYGRWLRAACQRAAGVTEPEQRLVFVNAWNEWAEGAYLEPDRRYGFAYLQATSEVMADLAQDDSLESATNERASTGTERSRVLLVGHDAHRHGAQLLCLNLARLFSRCFGFEVVLWLLEGGDLVPDYQAVAEVHILGAPTGAVVEAAARRLRASGVRIALTNTIVTGEIVPSLRNAGFLVCSLVHEMPELIHERRLQPAATALAKSANRVVFAADIVLQSFRTVAALAPERGIVVPQGIYQTLDAGPGARPQVEAELGLAPDSVLVMNAGYGDMRKGFDLFLDCARAVAQNDPRFHFLWVGNLALDLQDRYERERRTGRLVTNLHQVPFADEIARYYVAANIFLLTSREDPFPSVVLEALACGLPVVAFEGSGGHCELLREPTNGRLAPLGDVQALGDTLRQVAAEEAENDRWANVRAQAAKARFDFRSYGWSLLRQSDPKLMPVSVVIPNYNYARYMQSRLDSVFEQTHPVYEIIVLDDASTDSSQDMIQRRCDVRGREITLISNAKNSGSVFKQWVKGIREASGELIWIAEADDLADPTFLETLVSAMAEDDDVVLAFSDSSQIGDDGKSLGDSYASYCNHLCDIDYTSSFSVSTQHFLSQCLAVKNNILNVSGVVFRRDRVLDALDAVEDELPSWAIAGDWRLYVELCRGDGKISYIARPLNAHRRHEESVVGANRLDRHIQEIKRLHNLTQSATSLDDLIRARQSEYLKELESRSRVQFEEWPGDVKEMCVASARGLGVSPAVHLQDHIFRFLYDNPAFEKKSIAIEYYFRDGNDSATKVRQALDHWLHPEAEQLTVLEFASGYGAVTRHARDILRPHLLHSCDIHEEAINFLAQNFGVTAIQSTDVPEQLELPAEYDMIFVLFFFSHMPEATWARWLRRLFTGLKDGGVLLFTTHGKKSMQFFPQARLNAEGFWFEPSSEQHDLDTATYGQTITAKTFVDARISELEESTLLNYKEAGWWGHQDLYVVRRDRALIKLVENPIRTEQRADNRVV